MMENGGAGVHTVVFGLDPLWVSTVILLAAYGALLSARINRTVAALLGSGLAVVTGVLTQEQAFAAIDFNTISLLTGMMIIVAITRKSGVFEFVAIWSVKKVKADPMGVLLVLTAVTAVFSAFLDNLTTVLLVIPIALLIVEKLKVPAYPYLFSQILAANVGGAATLIGDPPNILIGSSTGLGFMAFLSNLAPAAVVVLVVMMLIFKVLWGKTLVASDETRARIMRFRESESIRDVSLLIKSLSVLAFVIVGFILGERFHVPPGTVAMLGAAALLLLTGIGLGEKAQTEQVHRALAEVEWSALLFFAGLFIIVGGVERAGLLTILGNKLMVLTGNDAMLSAFATLWISAFVSAVIDNIPFVATMIPVVKSMGSHLGSAQALEPVWWALALGACLGGNGSLVGAAANVMVAGLGERAGHPIHFITFMKIGLPLMVLSVAIANVYLYVRYFLL